MNAAQAGCDNVPALVNRFDMTVNANAITHPNERPAVNTCCLFVYFSETQHSKYQNKKNKKIKIKSKSEWCNKTQ